MSRLSDRASAAAGRLHAAYRRTGADLPGGDPLRAHGVAMEGYFWRFSDAATGRAVIALVGVNRDARGESWALVGLGAWPGRSLGLAVAPTGWASPSGLQVRADDEGRRIFRGDERRVEVDLGAQGRLAVEVSDPLLWSAAPGRSLLGGSSIFQAVPALNQYWHPWLLGGRASGTFEFADETWELRDAQVYGEKNWGAEGFPDSWWWGQAQGFAEREACVAFAGGQVTAGPLRTEVTALVVALPDGSVLRLGNPGVSPVRARVSDEQWELSGRSVRGWTVEVQGRAPLGDAHVLPVPLPSERRMTAGAIEHLAGELHVVVRQRGTLIWEGASGLAGLEHGGLARAEAELRRRGMPTGAPGATPVSGSEP